MTKITHEDSLSVLEMAHVTAEQVATDHVHGCFSVTQDTPQEGLREQGGIRRREKHKKAWVILTSTILISTYIWKIMS